jgi:hypothetical protein
MSPMFLPRRAWANWEDGPSSSDDDSIVSDVVPTTLQEHIEQFVRRGRLYKERKLERKLRREAEEEAEFDTPPPKPSKSGDLAAIKAAHKSKLQFETETTTHSKKRATNTRSQRKRKTKGDPTLESFFPKVQKTKELFYEMPSDSEESLGLGKLTKSVASSKNNKKEARKEKAPVIRRLPPPCSDDDSETEFHL